VIDERGAYAEFIEVPGRTTGLLTRAYKRKEADQLVYRVGTGLFFECRHTSAMRAEAVRKTRRCVLGNRAEHSSDARTRVAWLAGVPALALLCRACSSA
jgi:hypothetical protein